MTSLFISQPQGLNHLVPNGHPERAERLLAIEKALFNPCFDNLLRKKAKEADLQIISLAHSENYLQILRKNRPAEGIGKIDEDTYICANSFSAIAASIGAGEQALEAVINEKIDNVFCAVRPPGHHAEKNRPMGFCLVNNIAIIARLAIKKYGLERVAIIDFDVHHGNGTQNIFFNDKNIFYASSHQENIFPFTGTRDEVGVGNIVNCPLRANSCGKEMRMAYENIIFPKLRDFSPDIILISAGFDAEYRDFLANLNWRANDFAWLSGKLMDIAAKFCNNRIVSMLEGGYNLAGLADGVFAHVNMLNRGVSAKFD